MGGADSPDYEGFHSIVVGAFTGSGGIHDLEGDNPDGDLLLMEPFWKLERELSFSNWLLTQKQF